MVQQTKDINKIEMKIKLKEIITHGKQWNTIHDTQRARCGGSHNTQNFYK